MESTSLSLTPPQSDRALLRHVKTGRFFSRDGRWTTEEAEAVSFPNFISLVEFCLENDLPDVEIIVRAQGSADRAAERVRELLKKAVPPL